MGVARASVEHTLVPTGRNHMHFVVGRLQVLVGSLLSLPHLWPTVSSSCSRLLLVAFGPLMPSLLLRTPLLL